MMSGRLPGDNALLHLEALASEMRTISDFGVDLVGPASLGAAFLRVAGPHGTGLTERIHCVAGAGSWWFTWSWGDRIGLATDVAGAARAIRHVLTIRCGLLAAPPPGRPVAPRRSPELSPAANK
ncbi:hypothetical protein [Actinomadura rugatobispora]|uniref:Uncharacterized protein n=1 Tax=Actinomadura rugatobispora TaxID=1994 RepID=A0ABW1AHI5_9ACTN|nr:hypothetical protein GCM10010200_109170 [Actinomadura rugatobispora]